MSSQICGFSRSPLAVSKNRSTPRPNAPGARLARLPATRQPDGPNALADTEIDSWTNREEKRGHFKKDMMEIPKRSNAI